MTDYISQGKGKRVRISFPNLPHIMALEPITSYLGLVLRVMIVAKEDGFEFDWTHRVHASDEIVNIELNQLISRNPGAQISFDKI